MKGGLLAGLARPRGAAACGARPAVTFVANPDEEIGSPFSGAHIRELVPEHDVALVLECARANGDIVSARKGIADAGGRRQRARRARRRRAGEGPLRDPRGRAPGGRTPGAQRPLARRDRQRRRDRRAARRPNVVPAAAATRWTCVRRAATRSTRRAPSSSAIVAQSPIRERAPPPSCAHGAPPADGADARPTARLVDAGGRDRRRAGLRAGRRRHRRGQRRQHDLRPRACPRSTASARSAATTTRRTNGSTWPASCRGSPCSRR